MKDKTLHIRVNVKESVDSKSYFLVCLFLPEPIWISLHPDAVSLVESELIVVHWGLWSLQWVQQQCSFVAEGLEDPQVCWGAALQEALHGPLPQAGQEEELGALGVDVEGLVGFQHDCDLNNKTGSFKIKYRQRCFGLRIGHIHIYFIFFNFH